MSERPGEVASEDQTELIVRIDQLIAAEDEGALEDIARGEGDDALPRDVVEYLARLVIPLEYGGVLAGLAMQESAPHDLLRELAQQESLHWEIAYNPSTPEDVLLELAASTDPEVRTNVAENPGLGASALQQLAQDQSPEVREVAARHPATPMEAMARLAVDPDEGVRQAVTKNVSASDAIRASASLLES